jgi:hypothetical protein
MHSKIDIVLVHKIDRLARNVYDHATIKVLLKQHDIRLASVVENVDDTVPGQLVENIMASIAQFYSANLSEETRKGMRQKAIKGGWPHRPPRGYVTIKKQDAESRIEEHPREGPLMRRAFQLYASGWYSMQTLAARLAKDGLVSRSGGPIPKSHMHRLLTNYFYIGRVRWKDLDIEGRHPPLISPALFEQVQTVIHRRYRDPGMKSGVNGLPLRGIAICASCRGRMTGEWHGRWGYYRCGRQSYRKELCDARMCNAKRAHADLERVCLQVQITRATAESIQRAADRLIDARGKAGQRRVAEIEAEKAALMASEMRLTDAFTAGDVTPDVYKIKTVEIRASRAALEADLARAVVPAADLSAKVRRSLDVITSLWDVYEQLQDAQRVELLRSVFASMVVSKEGIVGYTLKPPLDALTGPPSTHNSSEAVHRRAQILIDVA